MDRRVAPRARGTRARESGLRRSGRNVFIQSSEFVGPDPTSGRGSLGQSMEKRVHLRIDPNDETITLKDIMQRIQEIQRQNPDLDVFFDGDEYAVCSRPKKKD